MPQLFFPENRLLTQEGGDRLRRGEEDHQALQDTPAPLPVGRQGLALSHRLPQANGKGTEVALEAWSIILIQ